jgi:hypothetical protein
MRTAMEHMEAAIRELEEKVSTKHVDPLVAEAMISSLKRTHERLSKLEAQLGSRKPEQT